MRTIVVDTDVFVAALLGPGGSSREVVRRCLNKQYLPAMGSALLSEYEAVMARERLFAKCPLNAVDRAAVLDAFMKVCCWTRIYFSWRPNLRDESDNHLIELAVAAGAELICTRNVRDFAKSELRFTHLRVLRPEALIRE
ncbi:MAG: putative toxin-antitoxin system toxin component, PIN family [Betaproteobacteria bacterium]|nr:putative toxin-antitoxin system toxin component, PIN family [Betaproteobacteria bacterium]